MIVKKSLKLEIPRDIDAVTKLKVGTELLLSGTMYTARDAAHHLLCQLITKKKKTPLNLKEAVIYYCGPTPARQGDSIGSCGPTTAGRMDIFSPLLIKNGLKIMIGKGLRSQAVREAVQRHKAVYLVTYGGCGAYLHECITRCDLIAYPELGPEAIYKLQVKDFPVIVALDRWGNTL